MAAATRPFAVFSTLLAAVLWGTSFPAIRWGLESGGLDPYTFVFLRFTLGAGIALGALAALRGPLRRALRDPWVWLLGVLNGLGFLLQFVGQDLNGSASKAALLVNGNVVVVAVLSHFLLKERLARASLFGVALGLGGVVLLATEGDFGLLAASRMRGDLIVFASGAVFAGFVVAMKRALGRGHSLPQILAAVLLITSLGLAPAAFAFGDADLAAISWRGWAAVAYTAVFCTAFAYLLWQWGLRHIGATDSALLLLVEILVGVALSAAWLGERLGAVAVLGAVLVMGAILLASRAGAPAPVAGPAPPPPP